MPRQSNVRLNTLMDILGNDDQFLFPCIKDLVTNEDRLKLIWLEQSNSKRQDVTHFLVTWFRHAGVNAEQCQDWMMEYATNVLSEVSSSSKSQIRHSTKSNIKFIYRSQVGFVCLGDKNEALASCDPECKNHSIDFAEAVRDQRRISPADPTEQSNYETSQSFNPSDITTRQEQEKDVGVKQRYRAQFEEAIKIAQENDETGMARKENVLFLNQKGFKTRTGRNWTVSILRKELVKYAKPEHQPDS